ncbi:protein DpdG [Rhodococcus erythropolis]
MGLINADDPLPWHLWATIRLLLDRKDRSISAVDAEALLSPTSLGNNSQAIFRRTTRILTDLGLIESRDDALRIANADLSAIHRDDIDTFSYLLRRELFADEQNTELTTLDGVIRGTGTLDLNRALCWFLSLDPYTGYDLDNEWESVNSALSPEAGTVAIVNSQRLTHFKAWTQFLGLAQPRAAFTGRRRADEEIRTRTAPDCTTAIRSILRASDRMSKGSQVPAVAVLSVIRTSIPVLPGGRHSTRVGITPPDSETAGAALSYALLRGQDEQWLTLDRLSDAQEKVRVIDPDSPGKVKSITHITFHGVNCV